MGPMGAFAEAVDGRRGLVPGSAVPDREETLQLLSAAARRGSVAAMRELLRYHERQGVSRERPDPLDDFDELAARRDR